MVTEGWEPVPLAVQTSAELGGRWTSLVAGTREWLWTNPCDETVAARAGVRSGSTFVDAGGVEECLPTIRGEPDHGDVWNRPWATHQDDPAHRTAVETDGLQLTRSFTSPGGPAAVEDATGVIDVCYEVSARVGTRFLHAAHALFDVSARARIVADATTARFLDDPRGLVGYAGGADQWDGTSLDAPWPRPFGVPLDRLGPNDGTAVAVILLDCPRVTLVDGDEALTLALETPTGVPSSFLLWRNLRGWPAGNPYRSVGVEPLLGRHANLHDADLADTVTVDETGVRWRLRIAAWQCQ